MKLLRRSQVCEELNISTATLYRKLKDGTLPEPRPARPALFALALR